MPTIFQDKREGLDKTGESEDKGVPCSCCHNTPEDPDHETHDSSHSYLDGQASHKISTGSKTTKTSYLIENMDCPVEERLIRSRLLKIPEISNLEFNLLKRILTVHHRLESLAVLEEALISIDMQPVLMTEDKKTTDKSLPLKKLVIATLLAGGSEVAHLLAASMGVSLALAVLAILLGGLATFKKGWLALINLNLNMNALMSFAVTGALLTGNFAEGAMVMVLFTLAEAIEARSLARAREAIASLLNLTPETALSQAEDGNFVSVPVTSIKVGQLVRVGPGERVALDGRVISGSSAVNQAPITGESLPVDKGVGDSLFAGSINEFGSLDYEVSSSSENSTIARIIRTVEEAHKNRAKVERFVDQFAGIYTPVVFGLAVLVVLIPPLFLDGIWLDWIYKGLVLLVIACPCALVISTPVTIVSAMAVATRRGLLIKGGACLEEGKNLSVIALDKTGTLTTGQPVRTDFVVTAEGDEEEINLIAASLSSLSEHPVSRAIFMAYKTEKKLLKISEFTAIPGLGISGLIGEKKYYLGSPKLMKEKGYSLDNWSIREKLEEEGRTVVFLAGDSILGLMAVSDTVRENSRIALKEMKELGLSVVMLTGDNEKTAASVARELGLEMYHSSLMPEEKLNIVRELKKTKKVGMVGDGINDSPALAIADIGFAMGAAGTDAAIETADVALMDDDLGKIPSFIRLSKATHWILGQNIFLALGVKAAFLLLTMMGKTSMWMAVFADIGICLVVVANGLRILKFKR